MIQTYILGQFKVEANGEQVEIPSRPAQSLLAYIVLNPTIQHRREKLSGMLWPDANETNARSYLRQSLWRIRKAMEARSISPQDYLQIDELTVTFAPQAAFWLDADQILERRNPRDWTTQELVEAVELYRGELLPGFYDEWIVLERERLAASFEHKMQLLLERLVAGGQWHEVLDRAERWISLGGVPEPAFRALMLAHAGYGDLAGVTGAYQRFAEKLRLELGVKPSRDMQTLWERILDGELVVEALEAPEVPHEPDASAEPASPGTTPYKGLDYFDTGDAGLFFGRSEVVAAMVEHLSENNFLAVVGASGSGKSSTVRAGLIPAWQLERLDSGDGSHLKDLPLQNVYLLKPTNHPLEALAACLSRANTFGLETARLADELEKDPRHLYLHLNRLEKEVQSTGTGGTPAGGDGGTGSIHKENGGAGRRTLIVVDQFEEIFTLCRSETERASFIRNILAAVKEIPRLSVVVVLRADFYAHCGNYPELREAIAQNQVYLGPMEAGELRQAIEEPASAGGWDFEPGLVDLILRDTTGEPGALPLLSHALLQTWQRRSGRRLTLRGYAESGGVRGAVARTAESIYNHRLTEEQQAIARNIFLRLTELGEGTEDTRRRAAITELSTYPEEAASTETVLGILSEARLITLSEGTVEVAHEALIREWPSLRRWLAEDREGLRIHHHLSESARDWASLDRDPGELYRGIRLEQAFDWAREHESQINLQEREFLTASLARKEAADAERQAQQERELETARRLTEAEQQRAEVASRLNRRLRWLAAGLAAILLVAVAAGSTAYQQWQRAEAGAHLSRARELAAAATGNLTSNPELSLLLALKSVDETKLSGMPAPREVVESLHWAVQASRLQLLLPGQGQPVYQALFSPDGEVLATAEKSGTVRLLDSRTGEEIRSIPAHPDAVRAIAFDLQGSRLATASLDKTVNVWGLPSGDLLISLTGHTGPVEGVAFSPNGKLLATTSRDWSVRIWDAATGEELQALWHTRDLTSVAFSPDGKRLATANTNGTISLWDTSRWEDPQVIQAHPGIAISVAFNQDGSILASTGDDGLVKLWEAETGRQLEPSLYGHSDWTTSALFSPDGTWLVSAGMDGQVKLWDPATGQPLHSITGVGVGIWSLSISSDGLRLAASGMDGSIWVWGVLSNEWLSFPAPQATGRAAFSPDGTQLAAGISEKGGVKVWDTAKGKEMLAVEEGQHTDNVESVAFSPDGTRFATASLNGPVKLRDSVTGRLVRSLEHIGAYDLAFSPDGRLLATAGSDWLVKLWEVSSGEQVNILEGNLSEVRGISFSPDGNVLAATTGLGRVLLWDIGQVLETGRGGEPSQLRGPNKPIHDIDFSPDGEKLAAAYDDGRVWVWKLDSRQLEFELQAHPLAVMGVDFSPDGKLMGTAGRDGSLRLWDASTGVELLSLARASGERFYDLVFSPDGKFLAATAGKQVHMYLLDFDELVALAESRVVRGFTQDECQKYLDPGACPAAAAAHAPSQLVSAGLTANKICMVTHLEGLRGGYQYLVYEGVLEAADQYLWDAETLVPSYVYDEMAQTLERSYEMDCDLTVTTGYDWPPLVEEASRLHPEHRILLVDGTLDTPHPNVREQLYATDQAAYLAGYLAAGMSKTGKIGTFGGIPIKPVTDFMDGFALGAALYNQRHAANVELLGWNTASREGLFTGGFCCEEEGREAAQRLIDQGADILFPVAGNFIGEGALQKVMEHEEIFFIGVDYDMALQMPDFEAVILTSVEKRMNVSVVLAAGAFDAGESWGGRHSGTLESGEVGLSPFHSNVPDWLKAELAEITDGIISGRIATLP